MQKRYVRAIVALFSALAFVLALSAVRLANTAFAQDSWSGALFTVKDPKPISAENGDKTAWPGDTLIDQQFGYKSEGTIHVTEGEQVFDQGSANKGLYWGTLAGSLNGTSYPRNIWDNDMFTVRITGNDDRSLGVETKQLDRKTGKVVFYAEKASDVPKTVTIEVSSHLATASGDGYETNQPLTWHLVYKVIISPKPKAPVVEPEKPKWGNYVVTYEGNGGTFADGSDTYVFKHPRNMTEDGQLRNWEVRPYWPEMTDKVPTRPGYEFVAWMDPSANSKIFVNKSQLDGFEAKHPYIFTPDSKINGVRSWDSFDPVDNLKDSDDRYLNMKAIWNQLYSLTFTGQDAQGLPAAMKGTFNLSMPNGHTVIPVENVELTIPEEKPTKGSAKFLGWVDDTGALHQPGEKLTINTAKPDVVLTAKFEEAPQPVAISFKFASDSDKELPADVTALLPAGQEPLKGSHFTAPVLAKTEVKTDAGTWTFVSWDPAELTVEQPATITGTWHFEAAAQPPQPPVVDPEGPGQPPVGPQPPVEPQPERPEEPVVPVSPARVQPALPVEPAPSTSSQSGAPAANVAPAAPVQPVAKTRRLPETGADANGLLALAALASAFGIAAIISKRRRWR